MPAVSSVIVPYAAFLRVYEPLAAFPEPERAHWTRYAARGEAPTAQDELRRSLADLVPTPPVPVPIHESTEAFVAEVDGAVLICPWRTKLRSRLALQEAPDRFPAVLLDAALPPVVRKEAAADWEHWRERNPDARPWIRTAVWQVPVRWFTLFGDEERHYRPAGPAGPAELRYRTPMAQARRRVARALKALRESQDGGQLAAGLVDVGKWLEEFHPRSLVELDYGGLVHALSGPVLAGDHSAADLAAGIAALRAGDAEGARVAYARLSDRWGAVRNLQSAN
ncbi:hypothetical protein [Streptomyces qinzhouensis]|uniref:DUF8083 domain-containing protein n=1 Tax=Streptomyces qinzhouensis TaxID=2599401 RepID=A0A5B8IJT7_9ACTN|nr:hypothetical protein [Streptomyces qinzhouensis]QDY77689.1 hypothetical protein FQU76_15495 [Streptomyces qinzhouensis]